MLTSQDAIFVPGHLECAIQPELVVKIEFVLIERKQSCRFRHNYIICQEDTKGFA